MTIQSQQSGGTNPPAVRCCACAPSTATAERPSPGVSTGRGPPCPYDQLIQGYREGLLHVESGVFLLPHGRRQHGLSLTSGHQGHGDLRLEGRQIIKALVLQGMPLGTLSENLENKKFISTQDFYFSPINLLPPALSAAVQLASAFSLEWE